MSSLSCLHTSCIGYLIPGSTRLIVQYCKHVISRSTTSDDLFVDTTLMATQSLTEDNSDLAENEDVQEIEDPILVAVNAGASLRSPTIAVIARKRKFPANEGKSKQRGSSKTTVRIGSQSTQNIILLWLTGNCGAMLAAKLSLRRKVHRKTYQIQKARERPVRDCKKQIGEPDYNGMFAEEG